MRLWVEEVPALLAETEVQHDGFDESVAHAVAVDQIDVVSDVSPDVYIATAAPPESTASMPFRRSCA